MKVNKIVSILVIIVLVLSLFSYACNKEAEPTVPTPPGGGDTIPEVDTLQPTAAFSFTVDLLTVTFKNESTKAKEYYWWFNDGNPGTYQENPVHVFPRSGIFPVQLIATGVDKRADTIIIDVEVFRMDDTPNPNFTLDSPYKNHGNWYRGQMHQHTHDWVDSVMIGSPDAHDSPTVMMETYRDKGYDFAAITDHWVYTLDPEVEGILFLAGEEVEANLDGRGVHANGFNISDTIPDGTLVEEMIAMQGSFVQLNHPTRSGVKYNNINNSGVGLWAIEISNWYNKRPMDLLLWDNQISEGKKIWGNAADDMHDAGGAGHNATMVNSNTLTKEDIIQNLLIGNFYATEGGPDWVDMDIVVEGKTISCTSTNGVKIIWYKHDQQVVKITEGNSSSYTPVGNEVFVRAEVQMIKDDDDDGIPNTAFSQPIFLIYQ